MVIKELLEKVTFLRYQDMFNQLFAGNLLLPPESLNSNKTIDTIISSEISELDYINAVSYCFFLNLIAQTEELDEIIKLQNDYFRALNIAPISNAKGLLFHRTNLLYIATLLLKKTTQGSIQASVIDGKNGAINFIKAILLANNQLANMVSWEEKRHKLFSYILKEYPYTYHAKFMKGFYERWIIRYWHIYNVIIDEVSEAHKNKLLKTLEKLEQKTGLALQEQYYVVVKLYGWYFYKQITNKNDIGFRNDPKSFYISARNFSSDSDLMKFISNLSLGIAEMKNAFMHAESEAKAKKRKIVPMLHDIFSFFNYPFLKITNDIFCITDFRMLIEGITSGLIWKLTDLGISEYTELKGDLGELTDLYFKKLIGKMFGAHQSVIGKREKTPDSIIYNGECELIFEFTIEYYKTEALYDLNANTVEQELDKILFNVPNPKKKSPGKFFQLNDYIDESMKYNPGAQIIAILVTERYLGDYSLLNDSGYLDKKISDLHLEHLKSIQPIILSLDDLEMTWEFLDSENKKDSIRLFIEVITAWSTSDKERHAYNFSFFMLDFFKGKNIKNGNIEHKKFFDIKNLIYLVEKHHTSKQQEN